MARQRVLLIGHGCREAALATSLSRDADLFSAMSIRNPSIADQSQEVKITQNYETVDVVQFASSVRPDLIMIGPEKPLATGLSDALNSAGFWVCAPSRQASQLEWDKLHMRKFLAQHVPEANVPYVPVGNASELQAFFQNPEWPVAVKPTGLTGGKGVRVEGVNLKSAGEAKEYALSLLEGAAEPVLLEKRIEAVEYTLHCVTDGVHTAFFRATYDYSYRDAGDTGPQTGGMGCYCDSSAQLPFMTSEAFDESCSILSKVLLALRQQGITYRGVFQGQFFLTATGIKICEFACRFGDPEAISLLSTIVPSWTEVMTAIRDQAVPTGEIPSHPNANVTICLAPRPYPQGSGDGHEFQIPTDLLRRNGVAFVAGSCEQTESGYRARGGRAGALTATDKDIESARQRIVAVLPSIHDLYYRTDVAASEEISSKIAHLKSLRDNM